MQRSKLFLLIFVCLCLLCLLQAWYYYPRLPERVASHFGPTGLPDAWMSKSSFLQFYVIVVTGLTVLFPVLALLVSKFPVQLMNLPNKSYWMSEERRQTTLDHLCASFYWFASATMILLLDVFYQVFQVQLGKAKTLTHPVLSLGIYISFTVILTVGLLVRFLRKKS